MYLIRTVRDDETNLWLSEQVVAKGKAADMERALAAAVNQEIEAINALRETFGGVFADPRNMVMYVSDNRNIYFNVERTYAPQVCEWFAYCGNPATKVEDHPVLTYVPICDRCADKLARMK